MVDSLSLKKMEELCLLLDANFPSKIINERKCYINNQGQYFIPRYVTDDKDIDCLYFEYADTIEDAQSDLFYDGEWIYIPDYPNACLLFAESVIQINS